MSHPPGNKSFIFIVGGQLFIYSTKITNVRFYGFVNKSKGIFEIKRVYERHSILMDISSAY